MKFAVFFVAALAFQATFAIPTYFGEGKLVNYLDEIQTEVKDLTLFLRNDFQENKIAVKTITWQCRQLAVVVDEIINKLHEEIFLRHEEGRHVLEQVTFMLKEIHSTLMKMIASTDMSDLHEVKQHFIVCVESVFENIDKLVRLTYTICPEFRFTLKYLLVDFMTTLRNIRGHFKQMTMTVDMEVTPKQMVMKIHEYTRECSEILKELNHPMQMKVALRGYLKYVREILYHLEKQSIKGEKEFDLLMHHLTNKLREVVFPLMQLTMTEEMTDMKVLRTKVVSHLFDIVGIYEQLIQWCETKYIPVDIKYFIEKVMFYYMYAVKQVCYEIKLGHKIGFFMPEYYTNTFYGKYGYGLYEHMWRDRFMTSDMDMYTLFPMNKYFMNKHEKMYTPKMNNFDMMYSSKYGMDFYTPKYGMDKYYKRMTYEFENQTPKELVMHIQMLVKRIADNFEYKTMNGIEMKETTIYYIREFLTCLDIMSTKMESITYTDMMLKEFLMNLKQMKMELEKMMTMRMFYNIHEIRMYLVRCMKMVATDLQKMVLVENYEMKQFDDELLDKICAVFMQFLNKFNTKYTIYDREYTTMSYMPKALFSGLNTHKEIMMRMHTLTKRIFEVMRPHNMEMKHMAVFYIRNFIEIIDYVMEKMHVSMMEKTMYDQTIMREVFMNLKQMKMELESVDIHKMYDTNMTKVMMCIMDSMKMFTMCMDKLVMFEDGQIENSFLLKDICMRYIMFLEKFYTIVNKFEMEHLPVKNYNALYHGSEMKRMMPFYWREMDY